MDCIGMSSLPHLMDTWFFILRQRSNFSLGSIEKGASPFKERNEKWKSNSTFPCLVSLVKFIFSLYDLPLRPFFLSFFSPFFFHFSVSFPCNEQLFNMDFVFLFILTLFFFYITFRLIKVLFKLFSEAIFFFFFSFQ